MARVLQSDRRFGFVLTSGYQLLTLARMKRNLYRWIRAHGCALTQSHLDRNFAARQRLTLAVGLTLSVAVLSGSAATEWTEENNRALIAMHAAFEVFDSPRVTTDDIVRLLEMKGGEIVNSNFLIARIAARANDNPRLSFSMTPRDISRLKRAGATPELIAAMKSPASVAQPPMVIDANSLRVAANQVASAAGGSTEGTSSQANMELIIDASGSMAAKISGRSKMDIAKQALTELLLSVPSGTNLAVRAYGHRKKDDCSDIELVSNFGEPRSAVPAKVNSLKPLGKTPLSSSITQAAKDFAGKEGQENTIILITDGEETCNADPCAAAKLAHESGVNVKINVIGFKIDPKERAQLECIANAGGGKYVSANDAAELTAATKQVAQVESTPPPAATANPVSDNILAAQNGGQLLVAPHDGWNQTNDGKEDLVMLRPGEEAVFAFKDEQPATFDNFSTLVTEASDSNLKGFELLAGDESPTGTFRSIGTFTVQNAKLLKSPYQAFKFEPVTAKYLKVKLISNYGNPLGRIHVSEFKVTGKTNVADAETATTKAPEKKIDNNILAASNGGQLLVAPDDDWNKLIDGKEDYVMVRPGQEAVYAFKDEQPATFERFATLVSETAGWNLKEFELLAGDESSTGTFRSIGRFTVQNAKMLKSPYQEFKFDPVTAKYLKIKLNSNYGDARGKIYVSEFKVLGQVNSAGASEGSTTKSSAESAPKTSGQKKAEGTNLLAASAGGQVLVAPDDDWSKTIDGKEDYVMFKPDQEAVYAFKDEKPATFDRFATLVSESMDSNLKEFELLAGDESPTGTFRSIGTFTVQNAKMLKSPYQEFKFDPVTAKYLKVKVISNYGNPIGRIHVSEFKLFSSGGSE